MLLVRAVILLTDVCVPLLPTAFDITDAADDDTAGERSTKIGAQRCA